MKKKWLLELKKVEFIGMHFKDGQYIAQPHIAQELHNFPDSNFTKKQVQQFLRIVNYVSEFIPNLTKMISPLRQLLKKYSPA